MLNITGFSNKRDIRVQVCHLLNGILISRPDGMRALNGGSEKS